MSNDDRKLALLSKWKEKVSRNLTDIESRDDLSVDEKSNRIIHNLKIFLFVFPGQTA